MNFFYGIKSKLLSSYLTIPKFKNNSERDSSYRLFSSIPENNYWRYDLVNCISNEDFYFVEEEIITNEKIFFLAKVNEVRGEGKRLEKLNSYTDSTPAFRANLKIKNQEGGFSSYQSEYPFSMVTKKGSIISSLNSLTNINADINQVFIKNIYEYPVFKSFMLYFVDIEKNKVVFKKNIKTNTTNIINIEKDFIKSDIFLFTKGYIGIPMFCSIKNSHISFEHTHPPHEYILSKDKFIKVNELKKRINDIIS